MVADVTEFQHCERATATSAECIACCQSAHFTIPLEERSCEALCPITHPSKRQLGDWFRKSYMVFPCTPFGFADLNTQYRLSTFCQPEKKKKQPHVL